VRITIAAPAKVNLWLRVGPPESSGFHSISTLFCALDLAHMVVLRRAATADAAAVSASFAPPLEALPELGPPDRNLAVRAAQAFAQRAGTGDAPYIELVKRIPSGGGLGGGSSDAGAVLRAMRRMHPRAMSAEDLMEIAAAIGSDVPFFAHGTPLALGAGRGDRLTPVPPLPPRSVVLVLPPFSVSTADAYRWLDQAREGHVEGDLAHRPLAGLDGPPPSTWDDVADVAANDFEIPVFQRHPELRDIRDALRSLGARPALLAGSGAAVFGVFADAAVADAALAALRSEHPGWRVLHTGTRSR